MGNGATITLNHFGRRWKAGIKPKIEPDQTHAYLAGNKAGLSFFFRGRGNRKIFHLWGVGVPFYKLFHPLWAKQNPPVFPMLKIADFPLCD